MAHLHAPQPPPAILVRPAGWNRNIARNLQSILRIRENDESLQEFTLYCPDDAAIRLLSQGMENNTSLRTLTLAHPKLSSEGIQDVLIPMVAQNLQVFELRGRSQERRGPPSQICQYLFQALCQPKTNTTLRELRFFRVRLDEAALNEMNRMIQYNLNDDSTGITHLSIAGGGLESSQASSIAHALMFNSTLTSLTLHLNDIGDDGAIALASCLKTNRSLQELDLVDCSIGVDGIAALFQSLETNSTLKVLDLSSNLEHMDEQVGRIIGRSLPRMKGLESLTLDSDNGCCAGGNARFPPMTSFFKEILEGLQWNTSLTSLKLSPACRQEASATSSTIAYRWLVAYYTSPLYKNVLKDILCEENHKTPPTLWPYILERINVFSRGNPDAIFQYLGNHPELGVH